MVKISIFQALVIGLTYLSAFAMQYSYWRRMKARVKEKKSQMNEEQTLISIRENSKFYIKIKKSIEKKISKTNIYIVSMSTTRYKPK